MGEVVVVAQVGKGVRPDRVDLRLVQLAIAVGVLFLDHVGAEHLVELPVVPHAHQHAVLEQERGHGVDPDVGMGSRWTGAKHQGAGCDHHAKSPTQRSKCHRASSPVRTRPVRLGNSTMLNQTLLHGYSSRSIAVRAHGARRSLARSMPAGNNARMHRLTVFIATAFRI
jgi:hypothetical protein